MSAPIKKPSRLSPSARASYRLGSQVIKAEAAELDAVLAEAGARRDVIIALERNQKAISLSDNRAADMRRYAAFRRSHGYPITDRWLTVIASCVAWEFDADATARAAEAKRFGEPWDKEALKARRIERIKRELRRLVSFGVQV